MAEANESVVADLCELNQLVKVDKLWHSLTA